MYWANARERVTGQGLTTHVNCVSNYPCVCLICKVLASATVKRDMFATTACIFPIFISPVQNGCGSLRGLKKKRI